MRALLISVLFVTLNHHTTMAQVIHVHSDGIAHAELIEPSDPRFRVEKDAILNVSGSNDRISALIGSAVLVRNNSSRPLIAYAMSWIVTTSNDEQMKFSKIYWHSSALYLVDHHTDDNNGKQHLLYVRHPVPEHAARLITPFFSLSKYSNVALYGTGSVYVGPDDLEDAMRSAKAIDVYLDSTIYADGTSEGPDTFALRSRVSGETAGIRSAISMITDMLDRHDSLDVICTNLSKRLVLEPTKSFPIPGATSDEWSEFAQRQFVAELLRVRAKQGDGAALDLINESTSSFCVRNPT
jgi:hypothetical protein